MNRHDKHNGSTALGVAHEFHTSQPKPIPEPLHTERRRPNHRTIYCYVANIKYTLVTAIPRHSKQLIIRKHDSVVEYSLSGGEFITSIPYKVNHDVFRLLGENEGNAVEDPSLWEAIKPFATCLAASIIMPPCDIRGVNADLCNLFIGNDSISVAAEEYPPQPEMDIWGNDFYNPFHHHHQERVIDEDALRRKISFLRNLEYITAKALFTEPGEDPNDTVSLSREHLIPDFAFRIRGNFKCTVPTLYGKLSKKISHCTPRWNRRRRLFRSWSSSLSSLSLSSASSDESILGESVSDIPNVPEASASDLSGNDPTSEEQSSEQRIIKTDSQPLQDEIADTVPTESAERGQGEGVGEQSKPDNSSEEQMEQDKSPCEDASVDEGSRSETVPPHLNHKETSESQLPKTTPRTSFTGNTQTTESSADAGPKAIEAKDQLAGQEDNGVEANPTSKLHDDNQRRKPIHPVPVSVQNLRHFHKRRYQQKRSQQQFHVIHGSVDDRGRRYSFKDSSLIITLLFVTILVVSLLVFVLDPADEKNWFKRLQQGVFVLFSLGVPLTYAATTGLMDFLNCFVPPSKREIRSISDLRNMNKDMTDSEFWESLRKVVLVDARISAFFSLKNASYKRARKNGTFVMPDAMPYDTDVKKVWLFGEEVALNRLTGKLYEYHADGDMLMIDRNPCARSGVIVHKQMRDGAYRIGGVEQTETTSLS